MQSYNKNELYDENKSYEQIKCEKWIFIYNECKERVKNGGLINCHIYKTQYQRCIDKLK